MLGSAKEVLVFKQTEAPEGREAPKLGPFDPQRRPRDSNAVSHDVGRDSLHQCRQARTSSRACRASAIGRFGSTCAFALKDLSGKHGLRNMQGRRLSYRPKRET